MKVLSWINKYVITDDVKANDANGKYTLLELIGPQAESLIMLICGNVINNIQPDTFKIINTEGMLFFLLKLKEKNGNLKFWVVADSSNAQKFTKYLIENNGVFNFNLVGEDAYSIYRIEQGAVAAPSELNDNYNPLEAGLREYISFTKGCYIGQEVIARLDTYDKVQKMICGIELEENIESDSPLLLYDTENNEVGTVTSSVYSLRLKKNIGLAYIRKAFVAEGTELYAKNKSGEQINVRVITLPFKK
jgi:folate-binding protein YgfZ